MSTMPSCVCILKSELFPMVVVVNIHFPIDRRELFSGSMDLFTEHFPTSEEKGMSTITIVGKSLFFNFMA